MKNPRMLKGVKLSGSIFKEFIEDNVLIGKLPSAKDIGPHSFMAPYEENTYQANFIETKEARDKYAEEGDPGFMWLPRAFWHGRIVPRGMQVLDQLDRSKAKDILGAIQYRVLPDKIEVIFMTTRRGWKRLGIMSILLEAIKENHNREEVEFWQPTKAGGKFAKGRRK